MSSENGAARALGMVSSSSSAELVNCITDMWGGDDWYVLKKLDETEDESSSRKRKYDSIEVESGAGAGSLNWTLWQLLDSLLPTGGFAHSNGLEAAFQARLVCDSKSLEKFLLTSLESTGALLLPFVFAANKLCTTECWLELNMILNCVLSNHIARRASSAQGTALLRVGASVLSDQPELKRMRESSLKHGSVPVHHAPTFGAICGLLGIDHATAQRSYLFLNLRDLLSAGTRLNIIGPLEASVVQRRISVKAEELFKRYRDRPIQDAHQTSPLTDTVQGGHDELFSRLFSS